MLRRETFSYGAHDADLRNAVFILAHRRHHPLELATSLLWVRDTAGIPKIEQRPSTWTPQHQATAGFL